MRVASFCSILAVALFPSGCHSGETAESEDEHEHQHDTGPVTVDWDDARTLVTDGGTFRVSVLIEPDPATVGEEIDIEILAVYADDPDAHLHEVTLVIQLDHPESGVTRDGVSHRDRGHGDYRVRDLVLDPAGVWVLALALHEADDEETAAFELYVQP
jgi:hypothetical protein